MAFKKPSRNGKARPADGLQSCRWLRILLWLSLLLIPVWNMVAADYFNYKALNTDSGMRVWQLLLEHYQTFMGPTLFSLLICYVLLAVLLLLVKHAWAATLISGLISLGLGLVQYMKLLLNGLPLQPVDFLLAGEAEELYSYMAIPIPRFFWIGLLLTACWSGALFLMRIRLPVKWWLRIPAAGVVCLLLVCLYMDFALVGQVLGRFNMTLLDTALQTSNYRANGFYGGFALNVLELHVPEPEAYSEEFFAELLEGYEGEPEAEDYPGYDVILILAESFFDVRELEGVTFSEPILENFDAIRADENCYSGTIYTTAVGGGTARPESNILTGMMLDTVANYASSPYYYFTRPTETYVSNYQAAGYRTVALHLYNTSFYARNTAYPMIGFDEFYGRTEMEQLVEIAYTRQYATDDSTAACIEYLLEQSPEDQPTFLFAITIENHQPYQENEDNTVTVEAPLEEQYRVALETYVQGVKDTDAMIGRLKEYIDGRERPTVLVLYGDHKPTLYEVHTVFDALGYYDSSDSDSENMKRMLSTPFLVYANRPLEQGIFTGKTDNMLSDYHLMNAVAVSTGFRQTPYMQWLESVYQTLPVYNYRLNMTALTEEQAHIAAALELTAYDRLKGEKYSEE